MKIEILKECQKMYELKNIKKIITLCKNYINKQKKMFSHINLLQKFNVKSIIYCFYKSYENENTIKKRQLNIYSRYQQKE